jgi:hypothetical protein
MARFQRANWISPAPGDGSNIVKEFSDYGFRNENLAERPGVSSNRAARRQRHTGKQPAPTIGAAADVRIHGNRAWAQED